MRIIGFAGWSGSGKTTLITRLMPILKAKGLAISTVKHAHHGFDLDQPGKDSFLHRAAGAQEVLIASDKRWALLHEEPSMREPCLRDLLARLSPCDLVLVEGFRRGPLPKIEVHRAVSGKPFLFETDQHIIAVASDLDPPPHCSLPHVALDDLPALAEIVIAAARPAT